jgi:hypothetical protein
VIAAAERLFDAIMSADALQAIPDDTAHRGQSPRLSPSLGIGRNASSSSARRIASKKRTAWASASLWDMR